MATGADVETRQLRAFVAVAELQSFSDAAERLFMAQSTVSRQVAALEQVVGLVLLRRTARGVILTPAGEAFLPHVQRALAALSEARAAAAKLRAAP